MEVTSYELLGVKAKRPRPYPDKPVEEVIWLNKGRVGNATSIANKKKRRPPSAKLPSAMKTHRPEILPSYRPALETLFAPGSAVSRELSVRTNEDITTALQKPRARDGDGTERFITLTKALAYLKRKGLNAAADTLDALFADCVAGLFNVRSMAMRKRLMSRTTVTVLKYAKPSPSLHCHVDNISGGRGPIVTVNIGPPIYYDLIPVFFTDGEMKTRRPIRVLVESGVAVSMDGEMRYAWQHCIPSGHSAPEKKHDKKYTVKFVMPAFGKNMTEDRLEFFGASVPVSMN